MGLINNTQDVITELDAFDALLEAWKSPPDKKIQFQDDPLTLACGSYRIWRETGSRWADLESVRPTEDDRRTAEQLKAYYRERMVFESLKQTGSANVSEFRKKLALLVCDQLEITTKEVGMLLRMPYFYEEDRAVDSVVAQTQPVSERVMAESITAEFTLNQRVFRSRSSGDFYDYWLTSDHSPSAYRFVMRQDNNLREFIESLLQQPMQARATLYTQQMRGYWRGRTCYQLVLTGMA